MESGRQRRPLATGRDIAAAEIGHHAYPGEFGKQGGVADLRAVAAPGLVAHGLAVAADGANLGSRDFRPGEYLGDCGRILSRQFVAGERSALDFVLPR